VLWAAASALTLVAGLATLVGMLLAWGAARRGAWPGDLQQQAWLAIALAVLRQALLPLWGTTLASWLVAVRLVPRLDATWGRLTGGLLALAAVWFAPIGAFVFRAWRPTNAGDVAGTLLLCAGAVGAALVLPRTVWRGLGPGAFGAPTART